MNYSELPEHEKQMVARHFRVFVVCCFLILIAFCAATKAFAASEPESVQLKINKQTGNAELRAFVNVSDLLPTGNTPLNKEQLKAVIKRVQKECETYIKAEVEAADKRGKPKETPPNPPAEVVPLPKKPQAFVTPPWPPVGPVMKTT